MILDSRGNKHSSYNLQMEQYRHLKTRFIVAITLTAILVSGMLTLLVVEAVVLSSSSDKIDELNNQGQAAYSCEALCPLNPVTNGQQCCNLFSSCITHAKCFDDYLNDEQNSATIAANLIIALSILSTALLIFLFVLILKFQRMRQVARLEEFMILNEAFLAQQQQQENYDFDEESFDSYEDFIQYIAATFNMVPPHVNQERGDPRIKDSFVTNDETTCSVCMMELRQEKVIRLNCDHIFHSSCIRDWNQTNSSCPLCRSPIYQPPPAIPE